MKAETEGKLWWIVLIVMICGVICLLHGCGHALALTLAPHSQIPFFFIGFWSASSSTTKQESTQLQAAADNGAVNFGATYIGGNTGGAAASANSSIAGGTSKTRATAAGGAANTATGGNTGVINNQVAATGQYGTAVGAGATVQTGGITAGAGSTITVAEPTEAVAALNAALGIAAAAQNTSESVALEALDAQNGIGTGTGRGTTPGGTSAPSSNTQYLIEFALVIAAALGLGYFVMKKAA